MNQTEFLKNNIVNQLNQNPIRNAVQNSYRSLYRQNYKLYFFLIAGFIFGLNSNLFANVPIQLSTLLKKIEQQERGRIIEVELERNTYEVKICSSKCQKLYIDSTTGKENSRKQIWPEEMPPANGLPLSVLVQNVEKLKLGTVSEAEYKRGRWKIELRNGLKKTKLYLDPITGKELQ